jgi:hypothetical protein
VVMSEPVKGMIVAPMTFTPRAWAVQ